jgi:hypothetical protein
MRSGILINLIVVALCVGAVTAGQPAQVNDGAIMVMGAAAPDDPNNVWDPAQHFTQRWDSVTLLFRADRNAVVPNRSVSVACVVTLTDGSGLLGLYSTPAKILVLDQHGTAIRDTTAISQRDRFYFPPFVIKKFSPSGQLVSEFQPYSFSVDVPLDANSPCPLLLNKVQWSMFALVTNELKTVDVPFAPSTTWVELAPGLQILVEQATVSNGKYQYSIKVKYNRTKASMTSGTIHVSPAEPLPETIVMKMDVLNAQGKSIQDQGGGAFGSGGSYSGSGNEMTGTTSGSGSCSTCGNAATIRYTLAIKPYEKEIRFLLENVPVPILWY